MKLFQRSLSQSLLKLSPVWAMVLIAGDTLSPTHVSADSIIPSAGETGTIVTAEDGYYLITGGNYSGDGSNLFHEFEQFNLSTNEIADFITTPDISNILTLVNSGNASLLDGLLQVTGGDTNLFLINPAGVLFGTNARLNLSGDLMVTTADQIGFGDNWLNIFGENNYDSLVGTPGSFLFTANHPGVIVNEGDLELDGEQQLTLLGGTVINSGNLSTEDGIVTVAAVPGNQLVRLSQTGTLLNLEFVPPGDLIAFAPKSTAQFNPLSLPGLLTGSEASHASTLIVNSDGTIHLGEFNNTFSSYSGLTLLSGELFTSGESGGSITALGDHIGLLDATLNASGINGGGTVRIGGDYQGQGVLPNATRTWIDSGSRIFADALVNGTGGQAIVWANDATKFNGDISSRGGSLGGDGGFVEVSGLNFLDFQGQVDTSAVNGQFGSLLLDPTNIVVVATGGTATSLGDVDNFLDADLGPGTTTTINVGLLNAALADITLQATNDITFNANVNITTPEVGLTAEANNNITANANITTNGADINLAAGGSITIDNITTQGPVNSGNITLTSNGTIESGQLDASSVSGNGGTVFIQSDLGNILTQQIASFVRNSSGNTGNAGSVTLSAPVGNITVNGALAITSSSSAGALGTTPLTTGHGGTVAVTAGGRVTVAGRIDTRSQAIVADEAAPNSRSGRGGDISIVANADVFIGERLITISRPSGSESFQLLGISEEAGNITIRSGNNIELRTDSTVGTAQLINSTSPIRSGKVVLDAVGSIDIIGEDIRAGSNQIITGEFVARSGESINFQADVDTGGGIASNGNNITISATGDIRFQNSALFTGLRSRTSDFSGASGDVSLFSESGGVFIDRGIATLNNTVTNVPGDPNSGSLFTNAQSGSITINAATNIEAGIVITANPSLVGNAGNVLLNSAGSTEISWLDATAPNGIGGAVDITTGQYFRAPDSFTDFNGINASISTVGGLGNGPITIRHGGGPLVPFIIGDASVNGTEAAITSGNNTLLPTQTILGPISQGNIRIITAPQQETLIDQDDKPLILDEVEISQESEDVVEPTIITITYDNAEDIEAVLDTVDKEFQQQYEDYYQASLEPTPPQTENKPNHGRESNQPTTNVTETAAPPLTVDSEPGMEETPQASNTQSHEESGNTSSGTQQPHSSTSSDQDISSNNILGQDPTAIEESVEESDSSTNSEEQGLTSNEESTFDSTIPNSITVSNENTANASSESSSTDNAEESQGAVSDSGTANSDEAPSIINAQNTVRQIEADTGAKPAIIYAFFAPGNEFLQERDQSESTVEGDKIQQSRQQPEILWAFNSDGSLPILLAQSLNQSGCEGREDDQLFLILVSSNENVISKHIPNATCSEVIERSRRFRQTVNSLSPTYLPHSQQLYEWLIRPLVAEFKQANIDNLVFIMDQGLRATPLAALHDGQNFLVQNYSLGLMPSLNITDTSYQNIQTTQILPAGMSDFSRLESLDNLPAVPFEISNITANWLGNGEPLLESTATIDNLQSARGAHPYGIVHIATHANFSRGKPENSYIQLWDEKLRLSDVREMGWNRPMVELLVLSACETASDSFEAELGFAGFASQAGVKSTLASLWNVSDLGTSGLMTEFYTQLRTSNPPIKAEALRQAQLAMLKGEVALNSNSLFWSGGTVALPENLTTTLNAKGNLPDLSHPFYWSGFTLVGSPW